jgi:hypothetical protein
MIAKLSTVINNTATTSRQRVRNTANGMNGAHAILGNWLVESGGRGYTKGASPVDGSCLGVVRVSSSVPYKNLINNVPKDLLSK